MSMFSRHEEIAISILVTCARAGDSRITSESAAIAVDTTSPQVAQIVHRLRRAGLLETWRGKNGGIRLARPAEQIRLDMVLDGMGAKRRIASPLQGNRALDAIARIAALRAREAYVSFTIADLVCERIAEKLNCLDCGSRLRPMSRHPVLRADLP